MLIGIRARGREHAEQGEHRDEMLACLWTFCANSEAIAQTMMGTPQNAGINAVRIDLQHGEREIGQQAETGQKQAEDEHDERNWYAHESIRSL